MAKLSAHGRTEVARIVSELRKETYSLRSDGVVLRKLHLPDERWKQWKKVKAGGTLEAAEAQLRAYAAGAATK